MSAPNHSWWPAVSGRPWRALRSLLANRDRHFVPPLLGPRRLWAVARSLAKGLEQIQAWIDCWTPGRSSGPLDAEAGPKTPRDTLLTLSGDSGTIRVFSERPVDIQETFPRWLSSVARTGPEPTPAELKEALQKLGGEVPLYFPLDSCCRKFESLSRNATGLLHYITADDNASVATLDCILKQQTGDDPGQDPRETKSRQSVLLIHSSSE